MKRKTVLHFLFLSVSYFTSVVVIAQVDRLQLPARPAGSMSGSQFKDAVLPLSRDQREELILSQVLAGNVPDFLRNLKPVTLTQTLNGQLRTAVIYVTPEYLAIGSDADYFRMPMTPLLAQRIADATSTTLPTRRIVSATWSASNCRLDPSPIPPSPEMITVPVFWNHQQTVQGQRNAKSNPLGDLVAGHKKDVILSVRLYDPATPKRVCIYGWHQSNGAPIQPLYVGHEETYADYSHGIRLINNQMQLDGNGISVQEVLTSSSIFSILSDEATPFSATVPPRYHLGAGAEDFPYTDSFPSSGRQLTSWINRFTVPLIQSFSPSAMGGDGYVMVVKDASGGIDTTRVGRSTDSNYFVQCDIYCDFRPELSANGFDRVGIFARDNGNGLFCGQNGAGTIKGANYALTWDSHNGQVQCLRTVGGIPTDISSSATYYPSSQWRRMRIEAMDSQITFKVDGVIVASVTDAVHATGSFGIGYQEQFASNSNIKGTFADNFLADRMIMSPVKNWKTY